jgi:nitrogen regulatory protein PII-like uncharacterized protein
MFNFLKKKKSKPKVKENTEDLQKKLKECSENFKNINSLIKEEVDEKIKEVLRKERNEIFLLMEDLRRRI